MGALVAAGSMPKSEPAQQEQQPEEPAAKLESPRQAEAMPVLSEPATRFGSEAPDQSMAADSSMFHSALSETMN